MSMQDENQADQKRKPEFSMQWEHSDVVLLVEGQHFHVHRLILAMSSPIFSRMFSSDFKEKDADKIPLPEKKAAEIREMLMVIYPRFCKPVNDTNLHFLLPLAREYQMTLLTQRCEDHLLRLADKEHEIGPLLETLMVAQNYSLKRVVAECVNKTQKFNIEEVQGHELYKQVEPLSQRKMIELQMYNIEKKLNDAKAELLECEAKNSKLQDKIREMKTFASIGLQSFESVVATLGSHLRFAGLKIHDSYFNFKFTTEQNLATVYADNSDNTNRPCSTLKPAHNPLKELKNKLEAIRDSN